MRKVIKYLSHTKAIILLMIRKVIKYLSHTKAIILNDTEGN